MRCIACKMKTHNKYGESQMNQFDRQLPISKNLQRTAWRISLTPASIALVAILSISAMNVQATADELNKEAKPASIEKTNADRTANNMVKICDALIAGKITSEEAAKKMIVLTQEQSRWDRITHRIESAVESGKLTREEANAKYAELTESKPKENKPGSKRAEAFLKEVSAKLHAAVESGEITEAQAEERMESAKKQVASRLGGEKDNTNARAEAYLKKVGEEIRVAIANGEITAEEGKAKYTTAVQRIKERMALAGKSGEDNDAWEGFKRRIEHAVDSGKMTEEEAREAYAKFRKRMGAKDGDREHKTGRDHQELSDDCMALRRKLGTAVRNGEMTREEAGKVWEEEGC